MTPSFSNPYLVTALDELVSTVLEALCSNAQWQHTHASSASPIKFLCDVDVFILGFLYM